MTKTEKAQAKRARRAARNEMHPGAFSAYAKANAFALPSERPRPRSARPREIKQALMGALASRVPMATALMAALAVKPEAPASVEEGK
jgi:hypothetical protein